MAQKIDWTIFDLKPTCPAGLRAFNANGDVVRLACLQWKCDHCRKILSYRWATRVRYGLALWGGPKRHWTVTLSGKVKSPAFAFSILPKCWDNFRKAMQRSGGTWNYAAFVELHPKRAGIAHFHIVSLAECPKRINDFAHHAGFGYKATDTEITGIEAAIYVTKYTSKQGANMPKGFRRVRLSHGWPTLPTAVNETPVMPPKRGEPLEDYFRRVSVATHVGLPDIVARWEYPELDL